MKQDTTAKRLLLLLIIYSTPHEQPESKLLGNNELSWQFHGQIVRNTLDQSFPKYFLYKLWWGCHGHWTASYLTVCGRKNTIALVAGDYCTPWDKRERKKIRIYNNRILFHGSGGKNPLFAFSLTSAISIWEKQENLVKKLTTSTRASTGHLNY